MINILLGVDDSKQMAHTLHFDILNGTIRSVAGSYKDPATLDLWSKYEANALYSDYEIGLETGDGDRYFAMCDTPSQSLIAHDTTVENDPTWLAWLRAMVNTRSLLIINDKPVQLTNIKDSNSSLSLVMTYIQDNKFWTKRLSGVDFSGAVLNTADMKFLTTNQCPPPFEAYTGTPREEVNADGDTLIYSQLSVNNLQYFRKLPAVVTDLYAVSKLIMLQDVLEMVTTLLYSQLFEPTPVDRSDSIPSDYVSRGFVSIKGKKYKDKKKTALMFLSELGHIAQNPDYQTSRLAEESVFIAFSKCYTDSLTDMKRHYFQYKQLQSLLAIILMECKLNLFYNPNLLNRKPLGVLDYNLLIETGGTP